MGVAPKSVHPRRLMTHPKGVDALLPPPLPLHPSRRDQDHDGGSDERRKGHHPDGSSSPNDGSTGQPTAAVLASRSSGRGRSAASSGADSVHPLLDVPHSAMCANDGGGGGDGSGPSDATRDTTRQCSVPHALSAAVGSGAPGSGGGQSSRRRRVGPPSGFLALHGHNDPSTGSGVGAGRRVSGDMSPGGNADARTLDPSNSARVVAVIAQRDFHVIVLTDHSSQPFERLGNAVLVVAKNATVGNLFNHAEMSANPCDTVQRDSGVTPTVHEAPVVRAASEI
eukprot:GHVU01195072.1.p1 GENE.GHVU01195072.1~~GHVU01195072.1.p1  ORF type:complete len:282 (+),score=31.39 GHVU01195072.1:1037-1882(+)